VQHESVRQRESDPARRAGVEHEFDLRRLLDRQVACGFERKIADARYACPRVPKTPGIERAPSNFMSASRRFIPPLFPAAPRAGSYENLLDSTRP
jgi:hypothetical protein